MWVHSVTADGLLLLQTMLVDRWEMVSVLNFDCSKFLLYLLKEPNGKMCSKLLFLGLYDAAITGILNF